MVKRRWIKTEQRPPPVSSPTRRTWLELYLPERVQGESMVHKERGLAMGLHLGNGQFRLAGQANSTTERVSAWRLLAGNSKPVTQTIKTFEPGA